MTGRLGYTTGACAAAAGKAALRCLLEGEQIIDAVEIPFPDASRHRLPIAFVRKTEDGAEAGVVKDAGDDPDITHGSTIIARVTWEPCGDVLFAAGEGVGIVTKKGLSLPPGEPAVNPGPRAMIREALREVSARPVRITLSIPGGKELAEKTYNPRLGVENGLSILGTTGRERPFSCRAIQCSIACELSVAAAAGVTTPVLVPGNIGEKAARRHFLLSPDQVIEAGNEWGFTLEALPRYPFRQILILGHPGKLAKLADGVWDTHSSRSGPAVETVRRIAGAVLGREMEASGTTEGIFADLEEKERQRLAETVCEEVARAAQQKSGGKIECSVMFVDMAGNILGGFGDLSPWQ